MAKCFVIFDLKMGKLTHQDIGQMQMYVNYYKKTQMIEGENEPIGILLCADKDDAVVEMTLGDDIKNVYASKYLTYLPTKEELIKIIKDEKELIELAKKWKAVMKNKIEINDCYFHGLAGGIPFWDEYFSLYKTSRW